MISCYNLHIAHPAGQRPLLDDISVDISRGEFVEIIGPSGAGKSLLCSIFGLRRRVPGAKCIVVGRNTERLAPSKIPQVRQKIGAHTQRPEFLEERSLLQNLLLPFVARGQVDGALQKVQERLASTALETLAEVPMRGLSAGQRELASIFRALVVEPELVIIDGGLQGLGELAEDAISALTEASRAGATVVLAARELSPCAELRTQVIRLEAGRLVSVERRAGSDDFGESQSAAAEVL